MTEKAEHDTCMAELRQEEGEVAGELAPDEVAASEAAAGDGDAEHLPPPDLPHVSTVDLTSEEGFSAKVVLRRGELERAEPSAFNRTIALGSACSVDYQRDAMVPYSLRITNTTQGYEASPHVNIVARTPRMEPPGVLAEIGFSTGPECAELSANAYPGDEHGQDYLSDGPTNPLPPGEHVEAFGYFVLTGFYSPAHPQGDQGGYRNVLLEIQPEAGGEYFYVEGGSGVLENQFVKAAVPVIPGSNGGCLAHPPCPPVFRTE
jgi:hypothetical protein